MLTIQKYVRAESLEQAWELNQNKRSRVLGGMLWLRMGDATIGTAIDLSGLGLDAIGETDEGFSVGAMVTLRQLETHEALNAACGGLLRRAVESIVGVQFRRMATVGGSVWGRFGFSDVLTALMALDAQVVLHRAGRVPIAAFAQAGGGRDILTRIIIPRRAMKTAYQSARAARTDFPLLTCAAAQTEAGTIVVIGARPGRAMVIPDEDGILAGGVTQESARAFARLCAQKTPTGANSRAGRAYRTRLAQVLCERALLEIGGITNAD